MPARPTPGDRSPSLFVGLVVGGFAGMILITILPSVVPASYHLVGALVCDGELEVGAGDRGAATREFTVEYSGWARCHDGDRIEDVTQAATGWLCPLHVLAGAGIGAAIVRIRRARARRASK